MRKNAHVILLIVSITVFICFSCANKSGKKYVTVSEFPIISDDSLLNLAEYRTFLYFWEGAEPVSGMAPERIHLDGVYPENDRNIITTGGSGFGIMAVIAGIERRYITRKEGFDRLRHNVDWLGKADRFHGAWPHWLNGETGKIKPFSPKDNGADLVETAYLMQGLLAAAQYFGSGTDEEKKLSADIDILWRQVEWSWFTRGGNVIYWHWSPDHAWEMNFPVRGYNECLILYVMAASSPTYPVDPRAYHDGWARSGGIVSANSAFGIPLVLKHNFAEEYGGPLFWAHYSYLGLDPRGLKDQYADYWKLNVDQALINHKWCSLNPMHFKGYSENRWGLTASYSVGGYAAHAPGQKSDLGVISPTAALSSFPYTPEYSMAALKDFYYKLGSKIWGKYGFFDAFSEQADWFPQRYLAIDQGPSVVMIENYRSALLWNLFMKSPDVLRGLKSLGFSTPHYGN